MFCQQLFIHSPMIPALNQILTSGSILFILGLKDDIVGLSPYKKFVAQFVAALIVAIIGDIRILDLGGVLGFHELSYPFSISLTVFAIVGIVNAFNLIDGIDGLAGSLGLLVLSVYAYLFFISGDMGWTYLCLAMAGALVGFLIYNITPAKIFMGDSGALLIGFFAAVTSIHFINISVVSPIKVGPIIISSAVSLSLALLIIPLFDTLRVFALRLLGNKSPFEADRNHLHHRLIDVGMSHLQGTIVLACVTACFLITAFLFQDIGSNQLIATLGILILSLNTGFTLYCNSYEKRKTIDLLNQIKPDQSSNIKTPKSFLEKINQN
jgi:UDP-N-acetylmuramyl pentapeptide phosphotransferase/UDP-N-acetylglucosamine-1-phosphate transferase